MIEINNLTDRLIDKKSLKTVAQKILNKEERKLDLSIVLVRPLRIKELNRKYRKKNKATDVLSFLYDN
jgi:ssRNA-specific RNase YbeY (16S rRNA maturation enzyme)